MITSELLVEYAMGLVDDATRAQVEAAIAASPALAAELAELEGIVVDVALAEPPIAPSPDARARLLDAVAGEDRFAPLFAKIAAAAALGLDSVRKSMRRALDLSTWVPGPMPGIELFHFEDAVGADVGLVRFTPGLTFPMHEHGGDETMIVLEGGYTDLVTGVHYGPGDVQRSGPGTRHALRADADAPLCFAIVLTADIRIILD